MTQYFWPENFRINDLAIGLHEKGHEVTVLTGKPNYPSGQYFNGYSFFGKSREIYQGINIIRVPLISRGSGRAFKLILNYISFVLFSVVLAPFYCKGDYDVIFVYEPSPITVGIPARLLGWMKKAPVFFWVQDLWPESLVATNTTSNKFILASVGALVRWIYKGCDLILVQSRSFTKSILGLGVPGDKIKYYPNSAEALYAPMLCDNALRKELIQSPGFIVMFAGNIGVSQDFNTILAAAELTMKTNPDIYWVIVGDGRQYSWLVNEVKKRGLEDIVYLKGRHPVESMPGFFSCADAMLVSLKKEPIFALTIPAKVQSYLACARPVIASIDGEGAGVITEARAGLAIGAEDPEALANAVTTMAGMSKDERDKMGQNALKYYEEHFSRDMLIDKLAGWMTESLGSKAK